MKIALYHGYELSGSGSNEYTSYLAQALARHGHEVVVVCAEPQPEDYEFVSRAVCYDAAGNPTLLFARAPFTPAPISLHQLPRTSVYPVYITDKQRSGTVKTFPDMTEDQLREYHDAMVAVVSRVIADERPDVVHANHLVYQPIVAAHACATSGTPYYVVPHGSSIEYTIKRDDRFLGLAREGLAAAAGIAWIAREVRDRVLGLFPGQRAELEAKSQMIGVGTDTSLFDRVPLAARATTLAKLGPMHRAGGKTAGQRAELRSAIDANTTRATQRYWDAYDHAFEDADLPERLRDVDVTDDLLFFVGAMTYGKGIQTLIAAMPGILARRPRARLVLVGSGTYREVLEGLVHALATGNERAFDELVATGRDLERDATTGGLDDLAMYAAEPERRETLFHIGHELAERVHFFGRLDHARLRHVFPCMRLAIFPSVVKEASPLVFAEALANGVLPLGAYHSGLRDGLDDLRPHIPPPIWERLKIAAEPAARVQSIVDNVGWLLETLDRDDMSERLRALAVDRYDWSSVAARLAEAAAAMTTARS